MSEQNFHLDLTAVLVRLRRSLISIGGCWLVAFVAIYCQVERLFGWLAAPLKPHLPEGSSLVFLDATEPFFTFLKLAAIAGLLLALPVILWQLWGILTAGRAEAHGRLGLVVVTGGCLAFWLGAGLGFRYLFPLIIGVLVRFGTEAGGIAALLSMGDYLSLALHMLLAFGLVCELPILMTVLARLQIADARWFAAQRRYLLIFAFVFGAVITPGPDVISQSCVAIPFVLLYEIGILGARCCGGQPKPTSAATAPERGAAA